MKHHTITGGGGTRIHLIEAGEPAGRAILFIHGFSQCARAWSGQFSSDLAREHRLVAMDMRGHGSSGRPRDGYGDSRLWADDVDAAIRELHLERPVLCGWSYGPLVILDYIRHHGEDHIGGIHLVDAVTKLGSEEALSVLTPVSHAQLHMMPHAGHAPFHDDAASFNRRLAAFCEHVARWSGGTRPVSPASPTAATRA